LHCIIAISHLLSQYIVEAGSFATLTLFT